MIGYFGDVKGEIIFASPKVSKPIMDALEPCIKVLNNLFQDRKYQFTAQLIANDDFNNDLLKPILTASSSVADTSELFMRGYQLVKMFENGKKVVVKHGDAKDEGKLPDDGDDPFSKLKVGQIAQEYLHNALKNGKADDEEIINLRNKGYSKKKFGINYPLLVMEGEKFEEVRYYVKSLPIKGKYYRLCSQWFKKSKPLLISWLIDHKAIT